MLLMYNWLKIKKKYIYIYIYIYKFSWSCGASQVAQWQRIQLLAGDRHEGPIPGSGRCPGVEDGLGNPMDILWGLWSMGSQRVGHDWETEYTHTVLCLDNSQMDDSCLALLMSCGCGQMVANIQISQSQKSTDLKLFQKYFYFSYQLKHQATSIAWRMARSTRLVVVAYFFATLG